jgi:hypothetical protein
LEGEIKDVPLFEQLCVLKEVDLHYKWAPFCSSSLTIADLDKLDTVGWFMIGLPHFGIARDGCFRAIGCDNFAEDGSFLLSGQGLKDRKPSDKSPVEDTYLSQDPVVDILEIPPVPSRRGSGRMTIRKFDAKIHVTSPTSASTRIVANIDPNIAFMPQSLLEFIMKHLAGVVLAKVQAAAKKVSKNPVTNVHAIKMREEKQFYKDWLMAKFQYVCDSNGWEMPQVSAFNLSEEELRKGGRKTRRMETYSGLEDEDLRLSAAQGDSKSQQSVDESVSLLSSSSGRSWKSNPIGSYLREIEEKTKQRKQAEIAATRQMAADRLKPSGIPSDKQARLNELKKAKTKRLMTTNRCLSSGSDQMPAEKLSMSQKITASLHSHGRATRFAIISFLVIVLFAMLNPTHLLRFSPIRFDPEGVWWKLLLEDAGVVVYIWLCSIAHFALCDIALVYAFGALEIGSKSGQQAKQFYSDNVRLGVASLSASILGFSVLKAATKAWIRAGLWCLFRLLVLLRDNCWPDDLLSAGYSMVPQPVLYTWGVLLSLVYSVIHHATSALAYVTIYPAGSILLHLVRSNFVGRASLRILGSSLGSVAAFPRDAMSFISTAIEGFDSTSIVSWRTEAFATSETLFSYTAIFLLAILVLFNLSAKSRLQAKKPKQSENLTTVATTHTSHLRTEVSSLSVDNDDYAPRRTRQIHATIPEDEVVFHDVGNGSARPFAAESSEDGASLTSTQRRKRFRFRRAKTDSMPTPPETASKNSSSRGYRKTNTV